MTIDCRDDQRHASRCSLDANLPGSGRDDAARPSLDGLRSEQRRHALNECAPSGLWQSDQGKPLVRAGRIFPRVREMEILRHQEPAGSLSGGPHDVVIPTGEVLIGNRVDIVSEVGEELDELMQILGA